MDLVAQFLEMEELSHKTMQELKAQTRKMEREIKLLCKENETLKQKTYMFKENEHTEPRLHNAEEVDVNEVGKKIYNKLQTLASKYKEMT